MIKAIIFDLDGVLVDTEPLFFQATKLAFQDLNQSLSEKDYMHYWTQKGQGVIKYAQIKNIEIDVAEYRFRAKVYYLNSLEEGFEIMSGAETTLQRLQQKFPLGLATMSGRDYVNVIFHKTKINQYFQAVTTGDDVQNRKPHPEAFLTTAEKLQVDPKNILVIEDAEKGVLAAQKAGMKVIAIPNAYTKTCAFKAADLVLKNLGEVTLNLVKSIKS